MYFGVVGLSFQRTPLEIMNRITLSDTRKLELYASLPLHGVVLSTCNRTELYFSAGSSDGADEAKRFFLSLFPGLPLEEGLISLGGRDALLHLFEVTAGLQSLVPGEDQILGQVKDAHAMALSQQCCDKGLNKIFLAAVTTAKKVKTALGISEIPLSLSYIGIRLLLETCGIAGKQAVVLGAGKMGSLAVRYLEENGAAGITVCTRGGRPVPGYEDSPRVVPLDFARRYEAVAQADLVVSATSAPHTVLTCDRLPPRQKPLAILDLALPLDAEPALRELPLVTLFNMDDLREISDRNREERLRLSDKARDIIGTDVEELTDQLALLQADRLIRHLNSRCDDVAEETMAFLRTKLSLSEREDAVISRALRSSLKKMIREPVHTMKDLHGEEIGACIDMAEQLYGLKETTGKGDPLWN